MIEEARSDLLARPNVFESGAGDQFVSTADDLLAFGRMMLNRGLHGKERIVSRLSVELMTTDQLTPEQKAASPFFENFWDSRGWGLGLSIVTRRDDVAAVPEPGGGGVGDLVPAAGRQEQGDHQNNRCQSKQSDGSNPAYHAANSSVIKKKNPPEVQNL